MYDVSGVIPAELRRLFASVPAPVAVITAFDGDGRPRGMTCSAISSVSLEPPLLLVCLAEHSGTLRALSVTGSFAVNFLAASGEGLARRFSTLDAGRFSGVRYANDHPLHAPVLDDAAAWARCRVHRRVEAGDHAIVIGEVAAVDVIDPPALLYVNRGYVRWRSEGWPAELAGSA